MVIDRVMEPSPSGKVCRWRAAKSRALLVVWMMLAPILSLSLSAAETNLPENSEVLQSDRVDGVHRDLATEIAPIEQGAIVIQLYSENPVLEVVSHELLLWPLEGNSHGARLTALFQGEADVQADLEVAGLPAQMADFVELPEQETSIEGRFEIAQEESGYRVVAEELPRFIEIRVKSRLAGRLVTLCRGLALFAPGSGAECEGLNRLLSVVRLPMPEAGETYFIEQSRLTDFEREQLDSYLSRSR